VESANGALALPVLLPIILRAARLAILANVTAPEDIVAAIEVDPDPEISPVSDIDWLAVR
jgi:hypothetical protein